MHVCSTDIADTFHMNETIEMVATLLFYAEIIGIDAITSIKEHWINDQ